MKVTPSNDASATSRKYVDRKIATKADKTSLTSFGKKIHQKSVQIWI